jgi:hypothetical protein
VADVFQMRGVSFHRLVEIALIAAALACVALAGARVAANLSLRVPLQLVTSGAEQEALDSIWRFSHGRVVYTDSRVIPYTASCFNWLFYAVYGSMAGAVLRFFHLGDAWLPTICRFITLALTCTGAAIFALTVRGASVMRALSSVKTGRDPRPDLSRQAIPWRTAVALAVLAFFNPLCGFWIITARPDLGAVVLELTGVAFFFRHLGDGRLRWIVFAGLALYGAWAFKQTAITAIGGIALTLLELRRIRGLLLLVAIWLGGVAAAMVWLGPVYRHQLYFAQIHSGFGWLWALQHLGLALVKMPLIAVAVVGLAAAWKKQNADPVRCTAGLILLVALVLDFLFSTKVGAGDYYFIPAGVWSALWWGLRPEISNPSIECERRRDAGGKDRRGRTDVALRAGLVAAPVLVVLAVLAVFIGSHGTIDCRDPRQPYEHLAAYLATRPGPVFVEDTYGDLPWISSTAPHFVVACNDGPDERAGVRFERGGWERLLAEGYFSTVVTEADGGGIGVPLLARYRFVRAEAGWRYFERK